jgi:hypothetical protein
LLRRLWAVGRVRVDRLSIRRDAGSWRSIDNDAALPGLLQSIWRDSIPILRSNETPERSSVNFVDLTKTFFINVGEVHRSGGNIAVEAERWITGRVRESATRWRRLGENSDWVADCSDRANRGRSWKKRGCSRKLDMNRRLRRVGIRGWRIGLDMGIFLYGRRHGRHDRGLSSGVRTRRRDRICSLAAVAAMRELVVMEATCQLSLLQVVGNVLVGHFLETGLKKVDLL